MMPADFAAWLDLVAPTDREDPGVQPAGAGEFLREVFDRRGPITGKQLQLESERVALDLAQSAVELVLLDLHRTTDARPVVEIRQDAEYGLIVSYNGGYSTPALSSFRNPEATAEVADYLQGEIAEDVWTAWPTCPAHGAGMNAVVSDGDAIWACRVDNHRVATIGQLAL